MQKQVNHIWQILLLIILTITGCNNSLKTSEKTICIKNIESKKFDNLFELKEKIEVELPDDLDAAFGNIDNLLLTSQQIIILDSTIGRKVYVFDKKGYFIKTVGNNGQGPGGYIVPGAVTCLPNNNIVVFDSRKHVFLKFNRELNFLSKKNISKEIKFANCNYMVSDNNYIYLYLPKGGDGGKQIAKFDFNFKLIDFFADDERLASCFTVGGVNGLAIIDEKSLCISGIFDPYIKIFSKKGEFLKQYTYLKKRQYFINSSKVENITCGNIKEFNKIFLKHSSINRIHIMDDNLLISYFKHGFMFDILDFKEDSVIKEVSFNKPYQIFIGVVDNMLVFFDRSSPNILNNENINCVLYFYTLKGKNSEK